MLLFGAVVGSFLNACIYRLPRGISLLNPRRSFCPSCGRSLRWLENIPVVSWLGLLGRCAGCREKISPRYPFVELLTAVLFAVLWWKWGFPLAVVYAVFFALLIAATFIDFDFFIIPDSITIGGVGAGVVLSALVPYLHGEDVWWKGVLASLGGASVGFCVLWMVVELGKIAFGRKRHSFAEALDFAWRQEGESAVVAVGEDSLAWEEIFSRESDRLVVVGEFVLRSQESGVRSQNEDSSQLVFFHNRVVCGDKEIALDTLDSVTGKVREITIPREAMGFGDVKFLATIGAFLGWHTILFVLFAASIVGCLAALAGMFISRDKAGVRLPFGPFLALGAVLWVLWGHGLRLFS